MLYTLKSQFSLLQNVFIPIAWAETIAYYNDFVNQLKSTQKIIIFQETFHVLQVAKKRKGGMDEVRKCKRIISYF